MAFLMYCSTFWPAGTLPAPGLGFERVFGTSLRLNCSSRQHWACRSEQDLQSKLYDPRIPRAGNRPERRTGVAAVGSGDKAGVRDEQVHVVGEIERFGPELQVPPLPNPGVLDH